MKALDLNNLPTQKEETWKYTPLLKAVPNDLKPVAVDEKLIHRSCGQDGGKVEDILWEGKAGTLHALVLKVVVEEGAELTLIERHTGQGAYWKNMQTQIEVKKGAKLIHMIVQDDGCAAVLTNMVDISVDQNGSYDAFTLTKGASLSRQQIKADVKGEGAHVSFSGVSILEDTQLGDTTITINHLAPHSTSQQFFRNILSGRAKGVFQGKVHVAKAAQKTDAQQICKTILLSDRAEMNTKPELEIYADDVVCSHGATTGQIDDMALFYMRSRGIPESEARMLLIEAFLQQAIDKILNEDIKLTIENIIRKWLSQN
jgi:Fe-S cluster assembly protein SufD